MKKLTLLWIEDDTDYLRFATALLKKTARENGYDIEIETAFMWSTGAALVHRADAVILDLGLPDSSTQDTIARIEKVAPHWPSIIVATGSADASVEMRCMLNGAEDWMPKLVANIDPHQFLARVVHAIIRRSVQTQQLCKTAGS